MFIFTRTLVTYARTRVRVTRVTRMAYSPSLWLMANWLVKQNQPVSKIETNIRKNHLQATLLPQLSKVCARKRNLLTILRITCLDRSR